MAKKKRGDELLSAFDRVLDYAMPFIILFTIVGGFLVGIKVEEMNYAGATEMVGGLMMLIGLALIRLMKKR